jgi:phosphatidylinositol 3-kinase
VERKNKKIERSIRSGVYEKDEKNNESVSEIINKILQYNKNKKLKNEEKDLVWKLSLYISNKKKDMKKFIKCVKWRISGEVRKEIDMIKKWYKMDVEDDLEILR